MNFLIIASLLSITLIKIINAFGSVHSVGFELDGDTESPLPQSSPKDWNYFLGSYAIYDNMYASGLIVDPGTNTTFEQSAKDTKDISTWLWGPDNNAQAKTDIYHIASYAQVLNGELFVFYMASRIGGSGITANSAFGFWFIQDPIFDTNGVTSGNFIGTHFQGDLLITCNFANPPYIEIFQWEGNGVNGHLQSKGSTTAKCNSSTSQTVCAIFNTVSITTTLGFPSNNNVFPQTTFMEGGINIGAWLSSTNLANGTLPCFSKILAMTRTSTSSTATLKDYGEGEFELCSTNAFIQCDENTVQIQTNQNGQTVFKYFWTLVIDQIGVGNIYDVEIRIPNGYNEDPLTPSNQTISIIGANTQQIFTYYFTSTSNSVTIPNIEIHYCFYPNCESQYERTVVAANIQCRKPTLAPTRIPTSLPTHVPTSHPTPAPTFIPTSLPSDAPTHHPSRAPTRVPSKVPTDAPSNAPTRVPSNAPSDAPTKIPSDAPSHAPSDVPSRSPSNVPTSIPTLAPTFAPSSVPTSLPTASPATTTLKMDAQCNVQVNDNFCFDFKFHWKLCNEGDRIMTDLTITTQHSNYQYNIPSLDVGQCIEQDATFEPIRNSDNDPVNNNFEWQDTLYTLGNMIIGGVETINVTTTSSFTCQLCLFVL